MKSTHSPVPYKDPIPSRILIEFDSIDKYRNSYLYQYKIECKLNGYYMNICIVDHPLTLYKSTNIDDFCNLIKKSELNMEII